MSSENPPTGNGPTDASPSSNSSPNPSPSDALLRLAAAKSAERLKSPGEDREAPELPATQNPGNNPFAQSASGAQQTWQFGVFSLLLATFVFAVLGAVGNQLLRLVRQGTSPRAAYAMFTLMAPVILVTVVSFTRSVAVWLRSR